MCPNEDLGVSSSEQLQRVREVRRRLAQDGPPWTRSEGDFTTVTVPVRDCDGVRDLLISAGVQTVVEVGLAYGSSALAIGEALLTVGGGRPTHVVIDPFQESEFSYVGWQALQFAGLEKSTTLILEPSSLALPKLLAEGFTADAAYVDGSHRFHEVFVDLYFLRKIVRPGGLVVLDDHWWPSVNTAERYYERDMGWQAVPDAFPDGSIHPKSGLNRTQAWRLPDEPFEPAFNKFQPF